MTLTFQLLLLLTIVNSYLTKPIQYNTINEISPLTKCECVPFLLCENGTEIVDGSGLIDTRSNFRKIIKMDQSAINMCEDVLEICCEPPKVVKLSNDNVHNVLPSTFSSKNKKDCGTYSIEDVDLKIMSRTNGVTKFGKFPWMIAVLLRNVDKLDTYQCGGTLINPKVVLTAAHCVDGKIASKLKIRAGEWDTQSTSEIYPHQDRGVEAIVVHENYNPRSLRNDVALLILTSPVRIMENVNVVCLSESNVVDYDLLKCTATGWGKNGFDADAEHQKILRSVDLSIVHSLICQNALRRTRLGKKFKLDESFICAGGVEGEDTCKGDGGSPLICPLKRDSKRFVQVGIVSWGIGCGSDLPAVYSSVPYARSWIDEQLMFHNLDNSIYRQ